MHVYVCEKPPTELHRMYVCMYVCTYVCYMLPKQLNRIKPLNQDAHAYVHTYIFTALMYIGVNNIYTHTCVCICY
jgi:hypothetical protein